MPPRPVNLGAFQLSFETPVVMGILNVTPDSFSDGGSIDNVQGALETAQKHVDAGTQILDVGGESTRPGALAVAPTTERARVIPVIKALRAAFPGVVISCDTSKAAVARAALQAGANIINDVTSLGDPEMPEVVAQGDAGLVLMHMRGTPQTMQMGEIVYDDVMKDVLKELQQAIERATGAGIPLGRIMVDPGIGFGKTTQHNLQLTNELERLAQLGRPIVYGASRKRFLGEITGNTVDDRDRATAAACACAVLQGAHILRVHAPAAVRDAVLMAAALVASGPRRP